MFFKNCSCYLNLVFAVFSVFFEKKKTKYVLHVFLILLVFENKKQFSKAVIKHSLNKSKRTKVVEHGHYSFVKSHVTFT